MGRFRRLLGAVAAFATVAVGVLAATPATAAPTTSGDSSLPYVTVTWKMQTVGVQWPQQIMLVNYTSEPSVAADLPEACETYSVQIDAYLNNEDTAALIAGGWLYGVANGGNADGPQHLTEKHATMPDGSVPYAFRTVEGTPNACLEPVAPPVPTWNDECEPADGGTTPDSVTIPDSDKVDYFIDGAPASAGTHTVTGTTARITAQAKDGFRLDGPSEWNPTFSKEQCAIPVTTVAPTTNDVCEPAGGGTDDTVTIPAVDGVDYFIDGAPVAPGTYPVTKTSIVVTATPQAGHVLSGETSWTLDFTKDACAVAVTAPAPTSLDECEPIDGASTPDRVIIPETAGVQYLIDGTPVAAGSHEATSASVTVTARAEDGYTLTGDDSWTLTFSKDACPVVTPAPPVANDVCEPGTGSTDDTFTIPASTGVEYFVDGTKVEAGTHPATGTSVTVTAKALPGYVIDGVSTWTLTFTKEDCLAPVTATAPASVDLCEPVDGSATQDTVTIPALDGVQYAIDGKDVAAGTYAVTGPSVKVTAAAKDGYVLEGTTSWVVEVTKEQCLATVIAAEPMAADLCEPVSGETNDTVTIPATEGVQYAVDGKAVAAGTYPATATAVQVTATAKPGYLLDGVTSWNLHVTKVDCAPEVVTVVPPAPVSTDVCEPLTGTTQDTVTIPATAGAEYTIDGETVAPGTYPITTASATVTATAKPGYVLEGTTTWTLTFTKEECPTEGSVAPTPVVTDVCEPVDGPTQDVITLPAMDGVQWTVDGKPVAAGTYPVTAPTVSVVASGTDGVTLTGTTEWTFEVTKEQCATTPTVEPVRPIVTDVCEPSDGTTKDTVAIPATPGVDYFIDGEPVAPGTYPVTGTVITVTTKAQEGYVLGGQTEWVVGVTKEPCAPPTSTVTPKTPTVTDLCEPLGETTPDTVVIPSQDGVQYLIDGKVVPAGSYPVTGTSVTVTAKGVNGVVLEGTTTWTLTVTKQPCDEGTTPPTVVTFKPTITDLCEPAGGGTDDVLTLPAVDGVNWLVNNRPTQPGTYSVSDRNVVVSAVAKDGYTLSDTSVWTLSFTKEACGTTPKPPTPQPPLPGGNLAVTGVSDSTVPMVIGASLLLALGGGLFLMRRRSAQTR